MAYKRLGDLLIAAGAGVLFCILAFIGILFVVVRALMFGDPTSGWPSMVCIILLCSGVQLFCTGIVGEYLAKTYLEVKHRPIYIVAETEEAAGLADCPNILSVAPSLLRQLQRLH